MQPTLPWIVTGDFNCIHSNIEKMDSPLLNTSKMFDFNAFVDATSLLEMPTMGSTYTWCNMNQSRPIHCHLDWTLISTSCLSLFPQFVNHVALRLFSDHAPLLITLASDRRRAKRQFKFFSH